MWKSFVNSSKLGQAMSILAEAIDAVADEKGNMYTNLAVDVESNHSGGEKSDDQLNLQVSTQKSRHRFSQYALRLKTLRSKVNNAASLAQVAMLLKEAEEGISIGKQGSPSLTLTIMMISIL